MKEFLGNLKYIFLKVLTYFTDRHIKISIVFSIQVYTTILSYLENVKTMRMYSRLVKPAFYFIYEQLFLYNILPEICVKCIFA